MDYITVASLGNSSDFGNLTRTKTLGSEGPSSGVRGTAPLKDLNNGGMNIQSNRKYSRK